MGEMAMRYFIGDAFDGVEIDESEIDLERGILNYDQLDSIDENGKVVFETVGVYMPNEGGMTHEQVEASLPLSDSEAFEMLLKAQIDVLEIDDSTAYRMQRFHPDWQESIDYTAGERRMHEGSLYRCLTAHFSQAGWEPPNAPSLWAQVLPGQQGTEIGEWVQPDSTNPYMKGDKVTHNGSTWESDIDNNVWEPGVYGWTQV